MKDDEYLKQWSQYVWPGSVDIWPWRLFKRRTDRQAKYSSAETGPRTPSTNFATRSEPQSDSINPPAPPAPPHNGEGEASPPNPSRQPVE